MVGGRSARGQRKGGVSCTHIEPPLLLPLLLPTRRRMRVGLCAHIHAYAHACVGACVSVHVHPSVRMYELQKQQSTLPHVMANPPTLLTTSFTYSSQGIPHRTTSSPYLYSVSKSLRPEKRSLINMR